MLAKLVQEDEISGETSRAAAGRGLDSVLLFPGEDEPLAAVHLRDLLDLRRELRDGLGDIDRARPLVLCDIERLRRPDDERSPVDVHAPEGKHLHERALPVLPGDQEDDDAEAERPVRVQFERVDEKPLLPGQEVDLEDVLGEADRLESARVRPDLDLSKRAEDIVVKILARSRPDPGSLTADADPLGLGGRDALPLTPTGTGRIPRLGSRGAERACHPVPPLPSSRMPAPQASRQAPAERSSGGA